MPLKWIVGVEPDGEHDGPLHFARWLQARRGEPHDILGVHVLPNLEIIDPAFDADGRERFHRGARETCAWALEKAGAAEALKQVELVVANTVDDGLVEAANEHGPYGCIVGRRARRDETRFQRLGPVARRLLRHLPTPLVVTPPDWEPPSSDGPLLLATDLADSSLAAAGFAQTLSRHLELPMRAVHVAPYLAWGGPYLEPALLGRTSERLRDGARLLLRDWVQKNDIDQASERVELGDPVTRLVEIADELGASLIICGSRDLGLGRRIFGHSVASEIAALAEVPVAVVPH